MDDQAAKSLGLHAELGSLLDRVIVLRARLEGGTRKNASFQRELARVRAENRDLCRRLDSREPSALAGSTKGGEL